MFFFSLDLDARFNKGLIDNCQTAIDKYCANEVIDIDEDQSKDDDDDEDDVDENRDTGKFSPIELFEDSIDVDFSGYQQW